MAGQYPDIPYDGPPRSYNSTSYTKRYVAIHNTSNDASAEAEASYAKRRTDGTSSHYYNDNDSIVQSLHTDYGANHAGSSTGNRHAIAYEITGVNGWTRQQWLDRVQWTLLARQVARDCRRHGIAVQLLTVAQMQDGRTTGLVTHDLMRRAWGGTTHTDPGPNFPMDHLLALVRAEMAGVTTGDDMALTKDERERLDQSAFGVVSLHKLDPRIGNLPDNSGPLGASPLIALLQQMAADITAIKAKLADLPAGDGMAPTAQQNADATVDELLDRLQE